ncbi:hypothetical protein [Zhihengliuella halotolerans]|uniref:hypothetical protein n=1 Tax=Zhihengliuella halotolerans TaxID=370736 RepID=UPI000C80B2EE|nr:hypothetical protein [Zhihengliuella halotolerans]
MSLVFADRSEAASPCCSTDPGHHLAPVAIVAVIEAAINHRHSTVRATITGLHRASGRIDVLLACGGAMSVYHHQLAEVADHLPLGKPCRWVPGARALIGPRVGRGRERTRRVLNVAPGPLAVCQPSPADEPSRRAAVATALAG